MKVMIMPRFILERSIEDIETLGKSIAFMSIGDPDNKEHTPIRPDSDTFKSFWFHDLHEDVGEHKTVSEDQLDQMYDFIIKNSDKDYFIVHCTMGVSRSGAVGEFVNDLYGIPYQEFKRENPQIVPNLVVKQGLNKRHQEGTILPYTEQHIGLTYEINGVRRILTRKDIVDNVMVKGIKLNESDLKMMGWSVDYTNEKNNLVGYINFSMNIDIINVEDKDGERWFYYNSWEDMQVPRFLHELELIHKSFT